MLHGFCAHGCCFPASSAKLYFIELPFANLSLKLQEKLGCAGAAEQRERVSGKVEADRTQPNRTGNILENSDGSSRHENPDRNTHEKSSPETKLHHLLESSTRADAVAAR